ncbi:unnamed protein product [Urochloa decumbens]|uniref:F-box domain-containing protein n=1 Tax=Urochloa decumbens TaxID=240449 RepID=A0ABC9C1G0_9POAL
MEASSPRRKSLPAEAEESETRPESLPSEIHERIVSLLPIRDAVRTSAVARAWRRIWESAPGLALDWGFEHGADPAYADAVLARYTRPVCSFFFCLSEASSQRADDWVPLLAGKGVQILRLHFSRGRYPVSKNSTSICQRERAVLWRDSRAPLRTSCSFENLKSLSLNTDFCFLSTILSTLYLLKNAPNLEELSIEIMYDNDQHEEVGLDLLSAQWTDGLLAKLKSVSMDMATCESNEMHFIEFVLSKARRLEEFRICAVEDCTRSNEELLVEIIKYRRASPQAKVFFKRMVFV